MKAKLIIAMVLLGVAGVFTWVSFDWWRIQGKVVDRESGKPLAAAVVLVTISGEGVRAPVPHAWTSSVRCIKSMVTKTDGSGRFSLSRLTWTAGLTRKGYFIDVFHPDLFAAEHSIRRERDALLRSGELKIHMQAESERLGIADPSFVSEAVSAAAGMGRHMSGCDAEGEGAVMVAMEFAITNAQSEAERRLVKVRCQEAFNRSLQRRGLMVGIVRRGPQEWPVDVAAGCNQMIYSLPHKTQRTVHAGPHQLHR